MRHRLGLQREGPNLCFYWQALYETEISHFEKKPKIDENNEKSLQTGLQGPAVRKNIDFFAPGGGSTSILIASVHSRTPRGTPKVSSFFRRTFLGTLRALLGPPVSLPRRPRVAPGTLSATTGRPKRVLESISTRFWMPRRVQGSVLHRFLR